jgi:hypothetical protein
LESREYDAMGISLQIVNDEVRGEFALPIAPGTTASARDRLVEEVLTEPLFRAAQELRVVLAADPHAFAHAMEGPREQGLTRFVVRGRVEGERLVPVREGKRPRRG